MRQERMLKFPLGIIMLVLFNPIPRSELEHVIIYINISQNLRR